VADGIGGNLIEVQQDYKHKVLVICMTTLSQCDTNRTILLPQSHDCIYDGSNKYWHLHRSDFRNTLKYAHMTSRTLHTCDISLGSLVLISR